MKRNTYTSIIRTLGCLLLLPVFASSCIHEDPELTADGEIGVDPTRSEEHTSELQSH